ncbi:unnamed protein product [Amoebophrya sp. A25]|nr:unnamed protein product [Amoebophrya sp. A25]|eukprot:GSA25T00016189001.1
MAAVVPGSRMQVQQYVKVPSVRRQKKYQPRPIGYRGNWDHGKDMDDPVYPTKSLPYELRPKHAPDWRNAGRALLTASLGMVEGQRMKHLGMMMKWQKSGTCGERCDSQCATTADRFYCAQRVAGSHFEYVNAMDGLLMRYKGDIQPQDFSIKRGKKPIHTVPWAVAQKHARTSRTFVLDREEGDEQEENEKQVRDAEEESNPLAGGEVSSRQTRTRTNRRDSTGLLDNGAPDDVAFVLRPEGEPFIHPVFGLDPEDETSLVHRLPGASNVMRQVSQETASSLVTKHVRLATGAIWIDRDAKMLALHDQEADNDTIRDENMEDDDEVDIERCLLEHEYQRAVALAFAEPDDEAEEDAGEE